MADGKEKRELNRFVGRALLACWPLLLLVAAYWIIDPFNVIGPFDPTSTMRDKTEPYNRCHQAVEAYANHRDSVPFNAFLLGSSRTIYYSIDSWKNYLPADAECFHFDAAWETLDGMLDKIEYVQNHGDRIKYAILEFHADQFNDVEHDEVVYRQDYRLSHADNFFAYHYKHFMSALNMKFIKVYAAYMITGKMVDNKEVRVFESPMLSYDPVRNEIDYRNFDHELDADSMAYFRKYAELYQKAEADSVVPPMSARAVDTLRRIKQRLDADSTDYQVILGPTYYRRVNCASDIRLLREIFGSDRVHVFQHYAIDRQSNFYDNIHYRYAVADSLMSLVYGE